MCLAEKTYPVKGRSCVNLLDFIALDASCSSELFLHDLHHQFIIFREWIF